MTGSPSLRGETPSGALWHVGRAPDPWAWVPPQFAGGQRWDDAFGTFRTVYAADSRYSCYIEVLAAFRPDPDVVAALTTIHVDPADAVSHPTAPAGTVPADWATKRQVSSAEVTGVYCDVTAAQTIAALRPHLLELAHELGLPDFDAAAVKMARPRTLTQQTASYVYELPNGVDGDLFAGVRFASRHGDDLGMWAIFERPGDGTRSRCIRVLTDNGIDESDPQLQAALALHGLRWRSSGP